MVVGEAIAVRLTSLEIRTATPNACHCQLCEIRCPPKAIRITPPGPSGEIADRRERGKDAEEFEITCSAHLLPASARSLSGGAIFLQKRLLALRPDAERNDLRQGKLLALGG